MAESDIPTVKAVKLLYGTPYTVAGNGAVKYNVYSDATNYKTATLANGVAVPGYTTNVTSGNSTITAAKTVAVTFTAVGGAVDYYVAVENHDATKVQGNDTKYYTESLNKSSIDTAKLTAFVKANGYTSQVYKNQYYLTGSQITAFFTYCGSSAFSTATALEKLNASTTQRSKDIRKAITGSEDTAISAHDYRVAWVTLKYEGAWHIDGCINSVNYNTVTYYVDGAVYTSNSYETGAAVAASDIAAAPTKDSYTFSGWKLVDGTAFTGIDSITSDISVYGTLTANTCTVTYYVDDVQSSTETFNKGSDVTAAAAPTKDGYTFSGWKLADGTAFTGVTGISADVSVYGTFTKNSAPAVTNYTVTYYVGGSAYTSASYASGANVTPIAAPTQSGYTFSGWKLADGTAFTGVTGISANVSVYGTFSSNGGGSDDNGNDDTNIPDNNTPTTNLPDTTTPTADIPDTATPTSETPNGEAAATDIPDEETAKAEAPKTGDDMAAWLLAAGVSGIALAWQVIASRKRRDENGL